MKEEKVHPAIDYKQSGQLPFWGILFHSRSRLLSFIQLIFVLATALHVILVVFLVTVDGSILQPVDAYIEQGNPAGSSVVQKSAPAVTNAMLTNQYRTKNRSEQVLK